MNEIKIIQMHHKRITIVMDDILFCLLHDIERVSEKIVEKINKLHELLREHQDLENVYVKPVVSFAPTLHAVSQAKQASFEFGGVLTDFLHFKEIWKSGHLIEERPLDFAIDARTLFKNIKECLTRKDFTVLPLIFQERSYEMSA